MREFSSNILLINKPIGLTSHDVVAKIRSGIKRGIINLIDSEKNNLKSIKVGHTGTLDPAATGLLIILIGREATKKQAEFLKLDKEYIAEIELGKTTDTLDTEGKFDEHFNEETNFTKPQIKKTLTEFLGEQTQEVPAYSAVKIKGKKLYELARKGKEMGELPKRKIIFYELELLELKKSLEKNQIIKIRVHCSSGTYIRSFARDLANKLGTIGYLKSLVRTKIGNYELKNAVQLEKLF